MRALFLLGFLVAVMIFSFGLIRWNRPEAPQNQVSIQTPVYEHFSERDKSWSVHIVRVPRGNPQIEFTTRHATGKALGLTPVTVQLAVSSPIHKPIAALNGDFYQRAGPYAGDPRGLQVVNGEIISAPQPDNGFAFWMDIGGDPHTGQVASRLQIVWPDGSSNAMGLNERRPVDQIILYTPALGRSTRTQGGRELILGQSNNHPWLPFRTGRHYRARVREVRETGDAPILPGTAVLSIGPEAVSRLPVVEPGSELTLSFATEPNLLGAQMAIGGGPILVHRGKRSRLRAPDSDSYEFSTMVERHPRSAVGFNDSYIFLVTVDGRNPNVTEGMTLKELADYLVDLGCQEALNLDGGGSATLWFEGEVRNFLCDGYERDVANSIVVCMRLNNPTDDPADEVGPRSGMSP